MGYSSSMLMNDCDSGGVAATFGQIADFMGSSITAITARLHLVLQKQWLPLSSCSIAEELYSSWKHC